jgi:hypothetical protein
VWALAFFRSFLHSSLFIDNLLQFLSPRSSASWSTLSLHLIFGLPIPLFPSGLAINTLSVIQSSLIRITCPAQGSLLILIYLVRSDSSYNLYNSKLYLLLDWPFSCTAPKMHLRIFLSYIPRDLSSAFVNVRYQSHMLPLASLALYIAVSLFSLRSSVIWSVFWVRENTCLLQEFVFWSQHSYHFYNEPPIPGTWSCALFQSCKNQFLCEKGFYCSPFLVTGMYLVLPWLIFKCISLAASAVIITLLLFLLLLICY